MTDWVLVAYVAGALLTWNSLERSSMSRKITPAFYFATIALWPAVWALGAASGIVLFLLKVARSIGGPRGGPGQTKG